jgi:hypothetical protein
MLALFAIDLVTVNNRIFRPSLVGE